MKLTLHNIEHVIDEQILDEASDLLQMSLLIELEEIEKNLWQAKFLGETDIYTEVQLSGSTLNASSCDCYAYTQKAICNHVAATLFQIRNDKLEQKKKSNADKISSPPSKINLSQILKAVSEKELKDFLRKYAREDRSFGLALKTRFANLLDLQNNIEKYNDLIKNIIKTNTLRTGLINQRGANQIDKNIKQLIVQSENALLQQNYSEAFNISKAILVGISALQSKYKETRAIHHPNIKAAFNILNILTHKDLAPAMRTDLWKFGLNECLHSKYHFQNTFLKYYQFLKNLAINDKKRLENLLEKIQQHLNIRSLNAPAIGKLVSIQAEILEQLGREGEIVLIMKKWLNEPEVQLLAIEYLMSKQEWFPSLMILKEALRDDRVHEPNLLLKFEQCNLEVALKLHKKDEIIRYSNICFLKTQELSYFEILKTQYSTKNWSSVFEELIENLEKLDYSLEKATLICELLANENNLNKLVIYLQKIKSIQLLQKHDHLLMENYKKEIHQLYTEALRNFLNNYFGNENALKVKNLLEHLQKVGATRLRSNLLELIYNEFGQRRSLISVLND